MSRSPGRLARESHEWASKSPGWIDFAFLGNGLLTGSNRISEIINARAKKASSGVNYDSESSGGRERPDGTVLKWVVSSPGSGVRGALPFFCGDVTTREWRVDTSCSLALCFDRPAFQVPEGSPSYIEHPSTTKGISHLLVLTSPEKFLSLTQQLATVIGTSSISSTDTETTWQLEAVHNKEGPKLILRTAVTESERGFVQEIGTGIFEVAFSTRGKEGRAVTPYGRLVWLAE
ncbi:hypothetical protein C0992_009885 [Termitomyces sp. T32_za158]|nr:hypothetical protein C0992_009885 [Termitomyces sp. T32_za158]